MDTTAILKVLLIGGFFYIIPIDTIAQQSNDAPYVIVLGTVQDGGSPHMAVRKNAVKPLRFSKEKPEKSLHLQWSNQKVILICFLRLLQT